MMSFFYGKNDLMRCVLMGLMLGVGISGCATSQKQVRHDSGRMPAVLEEDILPPNG